MRERYEAFPTDVMTPHEDESGIVGLWLDLSKALCPPIPATFHGGILSVSRLYFSDRLSARDDDELTLP